VAKAKQQVKRAAKRVSAAQAKVARAKSGGKPRRLSNAALARILTKLEKSNRAIYKALQVIRQQL
jgi:hypothetical protein